MFSVFKKIRHLAVVFALAIIFSYFFLFLILHPLNLVFFLGSRISAATGISNSASVPTNPINKLALELDQKEKQLTEKEQNLNERAMQVEKNNNVWNNSVLLAIFIALAILGILVILNFYFDRKREHELELLEQKETREPMPNEIKNF